MKTKQQLADYILARPGITNSRIKQNLHPHGVTDAYIDAARSDLPDLPQSGETDKREVRRPKKTGAMSRAEFAAKYDNDTRLRVAIRGGVASLTDADEILEDSVFRTQRCGNVHCNRFRQVAEEPEFRKYQLSKGGKSFWSHPSGVKWALENVEGATGLL
jgi:hypothetical protein